MLFCIGKTGRFLRTRFGEHRRAVIGNDANQSVVRYFSSGNHSISDMKILTLCPISVSTIAAMRPISKLGTVHPYGINERFSYV
jgi:UDP-N-acetyl-D-mannosaminuronate dehydrogenase